MFDECYEAEEEESPPSEKIHWEDESSTSSDPSVPKLRPNDKGTASYEMACLYAPQGVDLGGGGSPS